uniref:Rx N-terminal domain-containing protein n=1 Tax=Oryza punctata TaxID=4537 RepID=A0A0E0ME09_ORYPU
MANPTSSLLLRGSIFTREVKSTESSRRRGQICLWRAARTRENLLLRSSTSISLFARIQSEIKRERLALHHCQMAEAALLALSKIGSYAAIEAAMVAKSKISNLMELSATTLETVEASKDLGEQLEKMIQLRNLWIDNIKAEHCAELLASLSKMPLLSSLLLSASDENEKLNIENLVPTSTILQKLIIRGCTAEKTLMCRMFREFGGRLKYLALSQCHLEKDPLEGLTSCVPNLTYLYLNKVHSNSAHTLVLPAKSFPLLKTLVLRNMSDVNVLKIGADAVPCIEGLYIVSLSNLKSVPERIESLSSLKKLTLLGLHNDFKAEWNKKRMHEKMKHVTELRT